MILQELLIEMTDMYIWRMLSDTAYSGNGTTVNRLVAEYFLAGGYPAMVKKLDALAYARAVAALETI